MASQIAPNLSLYTLASEDESTKQTSSRMAGISVLLRKNKSVRFLPPRLGQPATPAIALDTFEAKLDCVT
jgi:hypothetical protein